MKIEKKTLHPMNSRGIKMSWSHGWRSMEFNESLHFSRSRLTTTEKMDFSFGNKFFYFMGLVMDCILCNSSASMTFFLSFFYFFSVSWVLNWHVSYKSECLCIFHCSIFNGILWLHDWKLQYLHIVIALVIGVLGISGITKWLIIFASLLNTFGRRYG